MTKRGRYAKKARYCFFFSVRSNSRSTTLSLHYQGIIIIPLSDVRSSSGTRHGGRGMKKRKKKEGRNDDPRGVSDRRRRRRKRNEEKKRRGTNLESEPCSFQSKKRARDKNKVVLPRSLTT